jgi:hypothetical protein
VKSTAYSKVAHFSLDKNELVCLNPTPNLLGIIVNTSSKSYEMSLKAHSEEKLDLGTLINSEEV